MDPKQLRIIKKITRLLEGITGWEGEDDDGNPVPIVYALTGRVYRGRIVLAVGDAEDAMSILEAPRPEVGSPAANNKIKRLENWTVLVQGFPKDDKDHPSDPAYYMKAATEVRLARIIQENLATGDPIYPEDFLLGGDITSLTIGQGVVRPAEAAISRLAMFYIPVVIGLTTDVSQPSV